LTANNNDYTENKQPNTHKVSVAVNIVSTSVDTTSHSLSYECYIRLFSSLNNS